MRRTVTLKDGSRYTCKAAYLSYRPREDEETRHAVAALFPDVPKFSLIKIIDPNQQNTDPEPDNPKCDYTSKPVGANQEVIVRGLFYVRTNHPAKKTCRAKQVLYHRF
jgi:hypothetical protein